MKADTEEIRKLLFEFRDEKLPDYDSPFHYEAEAWAAMKEFLYWLRCRDIAKESKKLVK